MRTDRTGLLCGLAAMTLCCATAGIGLAQQPTAAAKDTSAKAPTATTQPWPEGTAPQAVGNRLVKNLLDRPAFQTKAEGGAVHYAEALAYIGGFRFANQTGDRAAVAALTDRLDELLLGVDGRRRVPHVWHIDSYMFGALPLEAHQVTGDRHFRVAGLKFADKQFADARPDGLTKLSRFWADDVFMVAAPQVQAYRVTGDRTYLDRAATQTDAYLETLQQPNGLVRHGKDSSRFWARANGWVAVAMTDLLAAMSDDHPQREPLMNRYKQLMGGVVKAQLEGGLWPQLLDEPKAWGESSASAMFTYALATGARKGWLSTDAAAAARRGWVALCGQLDESGNVREVCVGTGQSDDKGYYLDRPRAVGDFHGQAAMLWAATALVEMEQRPVMIAARRTAPAQLPATREEIFVVDGFELKLIDRAPDAPAEPKQALIDTFLKVYPALVRTYNPQATRRITLLIDPDYTGVAEAGGGRIRVSSKWITERPRDFDLITHEAMHLVQAYPGGAGPGWITEGIADYVRHVHGVDNAGGGWSLPDLRPAHKLTDSYRVTARFFLWLETHVKPGIVRALDQAMREKRYADGFWIEQTGQAIEALWQRYQAGPELPAD